MAGDTVITVVGNLTDDPELRFTASGAAVANFTVASTPRFFDKQTNEWKDGDALFLRCSVWRQAAENVAESLVKGSRVMVSGELSQRDYEKDGQKHYTTEVKADKVVLLGGGRGGERGDRGDSGGYNEPMGQPAGAITDDDIPF